MICRSFEPIYTPQARILIVGSMPSVKSLEQAQYYAHPLHAFWLLLIDIFRAPPSLDYERTKALIRGPVLALWDAAAICEREGSLDSDMHDVVYNDFSMLYEVCTDIRTVLCNGATAYSLFLKSGYAGERKVVRMPSTSPAYTLPYEKKLALWKKELETN